MSLSVMISSTSGSSNMEEVWDDVPDELDSASVTEPTGDFNRQSAPSMFRLILETLGSSIWI